MENKARRKAEREAKRKAEEKERLREEIRTEFVEKGTHKDGILTHDLTDIDGYGKKEGGQSIGIIGGFLGQLMIAFNVISEYYPSLDRPGKSSHRTRHSQDSRPKTPLSEKSGYRSARSGQTEEGTRLILNPAVVQSFIYNYINEKLKPERLLLQVDSKFEAFLLGLEKPMALNEMRTMKEPNYTKFREVVSDNLGSPAL